MTHGASVERRSEVALAAALVVFGATGDLANRKLYPALTALAERNQLPRQFAVIGVARTEMSDEDFAARAPELAARGRRPSATSPAPSTTPTRSSGSEEALDGLRREAGHRRATGSTTWPRSRPRSPRSPTGSARPGMAEEPPGTFRRLVIEKPFGHDLGQRRGSSTTSCTRCFARAPDLPHRPLPGQGDGPEHPGAAVRERDLRAAVEPALRRPRGAHRGGVARRRAPRDVLRAGRRAARHRAEPPAPGARAHRDGAAGELRGRRGARREGEAAAGRSARCSRGTSPSSSCAASTSTGPSTASRCPATATRRASRPTARPRRTSRCGSRSTTGAGPACRSSCAPGKRLAHRVTEVAIRYKQVPFLPLPKSAVDSIEPNTTSCASSRTRASRCRSAAKVPGSPFRVRTVDLDFSYHEAFDEEPPEAYERVLFDALVGDATLFIRSDEVHAVVAGRACRSSRRSSTTRCRCTSTRPGAGDRPRPTCCSAHEDNDHWRTPVTFTGRGARGGERGRGVRRSGARERRPRVDRAVGRRRPPRTGYARARAARHGLVGHRRVPRRRALRARHATRTRTRA